MYSGLMTNASSYDWTFKCFLSRGQTPDTPPTTSQGNGAEAKDGWMDGGCKPR